MVYSERCQRKTRTLANTLGNQIVTYILLDISKVERKSSKIYKAHTHISANIEKRCSFDM